MITASYKALRAMVEADPLTPQQWQGLLDLRPDEQGAPSDRLITKKTVAELCSVSERQVERWAHDGLIRPRRFGRKCTRFLESDIARWITEGGEQS